MYWVLRGIFFGLICVNCAGCIWGVGGKANVDAFSVSDSYSYTRLVGNLQAACEPAQAQLTPLESVVIVTFFRHPCLQRVEFLEAKRASGNGGQLDYPLRLYPFVPFIMYGSGCVIFPGAMAFSEDCWPAMFDTNLSGGPSSVAYPAPKGVDVALHPVLYRHTRPFDQHVLEASRVNWLDRSHMDKLIRTLEQSRHLSLQDRRMVCAQLLELVEKAASLKGAKANAAQYRQAWLRLKESLEALGHPRPKPS